MKFTMETLPGMIPSQRLEGMYQCYDRGYALDEEIEVLKELKEHDHFRLGGWYLDAFAAAVMDVLEIEKYTGTDEDTFRLIEGLQK